jgi:hypothetical protein
VGLTEPGPVAVTDGVGCEALGEAELEPPGPVPVGAAPGGVEPGAVGEGCVGNAVGVVSSGSCRAESPPAHALTSTSATTLPSGANFFESTIADEGITTVRGVLGQRATLPLRHRKALRLKSLSRVLVFLVRG